MRVFAAGLRGWNARRRLFIILGSSVKVLGDREHGMLAAKASWSLELGGSRLRHHGTVSARRMLTVPWQEPNEIDCGRVVNLSRTRCCRRDSTLQ